MEQQKTVLLVMDMQTGILGMLPDASNLLKNTAKAISKARSQKIPIIYVTVGFRQNSPEISLNNKSFAASKDHFAAIDMAEFMKIHEDVKPQLDEVVVTKKRFSAFTGSDLEVVLRAYGAQHLIMAGISTSGVVLSTLREAADKDYRLTVLADCCLDADEEVHRVLTTKIFPRQADVLTVEEWIPLA
ncbi:nicotinamidase-related amidase [Chryseobacterium sp. H1D6B]|uniref:cysteine hydrolase family protein n=1 Tax=Chryseobacterium sp. H1D6B TaxID=2940588 RepID=UPI0015C6AEC8|nr:isochorismatase family cysteine hydrolase [Chryseobacterium sp. H1D6B]MDH6253624.1 nicotinamidase-related amidase [Chryseobacterium sp. H1D6B]